MAVEPNDVHRAHWAHDILPYMHRLQTARNITTLVAWEIAEGGWWDNQAAFNPLNTTFRCIHSHPINSAGVQAYASEIDGFHATVDTLQLPPYVVIMNGFSKNLPPSTMAAIVGGTPWGTSGKLMFDVIPRAADAVRQVFP